MGNWNSYERKAALYLVEMAWEEDLGKAGDITTIATIPAELRGTATITARADGIIGGLPIISLVYKKYETPVRVELRCNDGDGVAVGQPLAELSGPLHAILTGERTALNFLQRLSGVATATRQYVDAIAGLPCQILDTRKTTPGWRALEKYAVRCGGGDNHRMGLSDAFLIKDNHIAAVGSICRAIELARQEASDGFMVEVEVDTLEQLKEAIAAHPTRILLDNMELEELREAVSIREEADPEIELEASGGITLENVRSIAATGVDFISIGAITHSAPALDIAMDFVSSPPA